MNILLSSLESGGGNGEGVGISVRLVNKQCLPLYLFLVGGLMDIFFKNFIEV